MPRTATGNVYQEGERFLVRVTVGPKGERRKIALTACADRAAADERGAIVATLAKEMRAAAVPLDMTLRLLVLAGERNAKRLPAVIASAELLCKGDARAKLADREALTFEDVGRRWTAGELARDYPDQVKVKRSAVRDAQRLDRYVYPLVGPVRIVDFTLEDAEKVMRSLPPNRVRTPATRRHVAQLIHRVLTLAAYPLRIIKAHPLPPGFRPKGGPAKAKGYLYPDEDAALVGCAQIPLCWRVFYGFLAREGPRTSEAAALDLADVDLRRGILSLDENKTQDPRHWTMDAGVVRALRAWVAHRERLAGSPLPRSAPVFTDEHGQRITEKVLTGLAALFREHLEAAGVDRETLYENTERRQRIRAHDLRATFVTLSLANGKTESWVADRTGHKTSDMINKYRRAARTAAEAELGPLRPLDALLPELRGEGEDGTASPAGGSSGAPPALPEREAGAASPAGGCSGAPPMLPEGAAGRGYEAAGSASNAAPSLVIPANLSAEAPETPAILLDPLAFEDVRTPLNPLIVVRIHVPEPSPTNDGAHTT